jgi:hypothetical protein
VIVLILRDFGAAAADVGAVVVKFGFGEEVGAGAFEDAGMLFSRRALTAAMPRARARALTPLLTVKPAQRSSAISLAPEESVMGTRLALSKTLFLRTAAHI